MCSKSDASADEQTQIYNFQSHKRKLITVTSRQTVSRIKHAGSARHLYQNLAISPLFSMTKRSFNRQLTFVPRVLYAPTNHNPAPIIQSWIFPYITMVCKLSAMVGGLICRPGGSLSAIAISGMFPCNADVRLAAGELWDLG